MQIVLNCKDMETVRKIFGSISFSLATYQSSSHEYCTFFHFVYLPIPVPEFQTMFLLSVLIPKVHMYNVTLLMSALNVDDDECTDECTLYVARNITVYKK